MKEKRVIKFIILGISLLLLLSLLVVIVKNLNSDSRKFSKEYKDVPKNNIYTYANIEKLINILDDGTGIIYLCNHTSYNCNEYSKRLNEVGRALDIERINYYDTSKFDTKVEEYNILLNKLNEKIQYDTTEYKLAIPFLIIVKNGKIIGLDNSFSTQYDQIKEEIKICEQDDLKSIIENIMVDSGITSCSNECE